ncbi:FtsH protease activity modulator HflK [Rhodospirillaceae bacterium SYSU D60014]|uniref:FtsH protease activity modulator HflK n=1 Tax=Virgifigura deserti TaxID=2268457 RepID=UPI000E660241
MPWQNQGGGGGGPWGGGGGGQGPWGRGPSGQRPPDFEDLLRKSQDRFRSILPGGFGGGRGLLLIAVIALALWLASGFYRVQPNEQGVALIFGEWVATTQPGLNYNLPAPIGSVETPKVTRVNRAEVGFSSGFDGNGRSASARDIPAESLMLTGDENIIDIQFVVFWVIKDAGQYLFNIADPEATVKSVAESAMREIVGQTPFERARTQGRAEIEARAVESMQGILDSYGAGIEVTQVELQQVDPPQSVIEAFRDVQAARADRERAVNEAQAYYNEITQRAEGNAQRLIKEGEAYKEEKVAIASGDAQRFISVLNEYSQARELTTRRIYLETMEEVMRGMDKVLIDTAAQGAGGANGTVPYLALNELMRRQTPGAGKSGDGLRVSPNAAAE